MKRFFRIMTWEFHTKIRSKSFLFTTILWPLLLLSFVLAPIIQHLNETKDKKTIGVIDGSQSGLFELFLRQVSELNDGGIRLEEIVPDSIEHYQKQLAVENILIHQIDSVSNVHQWVKAERKKLFLIKERSNKQEERFLKLYDIKFDTKNTLDSLLVEKKRLESRLEETFIAETKLIANQNLRDELLDAYIYINPDVLHSGKIEYYSLKFGNLFEADHIKQLITNTIIQKRLARSKVKESIQAEVLRPLDFERYQLNEKGNEASTTYKHYIAPVIAFILLFISIFSTSGHLFTSFIAEKHNRTLEFLLSTTGKQTVFLAKIIGIGLVGFVQILFWTGLLTVLHAFNVFNLQSVSYLNETNLLYFFLYYVFGFLLYATLFAGVGVISQNQQEANTLHQVLRLVFIVPFLFTLLILKDPNAEIVRTISLIPLLTPAFMIMRIPLSSPIPLSDIHLTILIMVITIVFFYLVSFRLFRVLAVYYGSRPTLKENFRVIFKGKL